MKLLSLSLRRLALLLLCLPVFATGCSEKYKSPQNHPTCQMQIGNTRYTLEIVRKDVDRQTGLMRRDSMPADWGMIFVFPTSDNVGGFWMKNTRIPLDILYVDGGSKVVSIHRMEPFVEESYLPAGPYKYAIELNAGQVAKCGVKAGDVLVIPPEARETKE